MGKGIFITGTDTGVGKTFFTCGLAALLKSYGYSVGVMKPLESGCEVRDGQLFGADGWQLKQASGSHDDMEIICPYRFAEPLAPSIAAQRAGVKIDIDRLFAVLDRIKAKHDVTLVEGAGGLMVPLLPSYTFADFARVAKLPVLVVAANRLGAINHLLLTLEHASCQGLTLLGYVLNQVTGEASLATDTNREVLVNLTGVPCLGELPFVNDAKDGNLATIDLFDKELDLRAIELLLGDRR
jgi:dethiobiotin synthetase